MADTWYEKTYRRFFLDLHIDDWNEDFLSVSTSGALC
jgi:hypothetical protein